MEKRGSCFRCGQSAGRQSCTGSCGVCGRTSEPKLLPERLPEELNASAVCDRCREKHKQPDNR
ncbi:MAG: hypothetical protein Q4F31_10655 [Eubacteriales bacterium]|nr:hypothetical protein [Eubacteriales bacterium]